MDYMKLSDGKFFHKMMEIYEYKNLEGFEFLRHNPQLVDRLKKFIENGFIKGGNVVKTKNFFHYINSYNNIYRLKEILSNPTNFSFEDRKDFLCEFKGNYYVDLRIVDDLRAIKLFSLDDQELVFKFLELRRIALLKNSNVVSYNSSTIQIVRKIIDAYGKYADEGKFFVFLYDDLNIDLSSLEEYKNTMISTYFNLLYGESNSNYESILNDFSFEDIMLISRIYGRYHGFLNSFGKSSSTGEEYNYDVLYELFDMINESIGKFDSYAEVLNYIVNEKHIKYDDLEEIYSPIFDEYVYNQFSRSRRGMMTRHFKLKDLYNYTCIKELYKQLISRVNSLIEYINSSDNNNMMQIIYSIKYFNNITPGVVKQRLNDKIRTLEDGDQIRILSNFIDDYAKYYNDRKNETMQSKDDDNLDAYIMVIRQYLDSLPESVSEYFERNSVDKKFFDKALSVLKEHNHPIYEEYFNYNEMLKKRVYTIVLQKTKNIINSIKNGVQLEDGTVKDYDLIDYYSYTRLTFNEFLKIVRGNVSNQDYAVASRFVAKYKTDKILGAGDINGLYNTSFVYVTEKDSEGNPISTYEVTKEEKQHVIELIKGLHVPLTKFTWGIMFKRYISENILNKKDDKTKVLK